MNYELAKELQNTLPMCHPADEPMDMCDGTFLPRDKRNKTIGLEELIEACGDVRGLTLNRKADGTWVALTESISSVAAKMIRREYVQVPIIKEGSTPSEAVARLYLSLNKK